MIEEHGMHRLTDIVVAPEGEAQVAHTTADMRSGQVLPDPGSRTDEVSSVGIMLLHTCGNSQDVRVEDDVLRMHPHPFCQYLIGSLCYRDATFIGSRLAFFVEAHHYDSSPVAHHVFCMLNKLLFTFLQRDGVHDALALYALQASLDNPPVTGVDHHWNFRNVRLGGNHVEEGGHLCFGVEKTVIHIDVDDKCAVIHLFTGDADSLVVVLFLDQSQELTRTSHVTPFTNVDEDVG